MSAPAAVRPAKAERYRLRCASCSEGGFRAGNEFEDESGWVCDACGSNNYYPTVNDGDYVCVMDGVAVRIRWNADRLRWELYHGNMATIAVVPTSGSIVQDARNIEARFKQYHEAT